MRGNRDTKVSVIIPTYQEEKYIGNLLSRLAKMNPSSEIIVVDGGSTDETVKIARRFTDKVYQINQRGIGRARNYGAYKAKGDILIFLDADVTPPPDLIEKVLKTFIDEKTIGATCNTMPAQPMTSELLYFHFYNRLLRLCAKFKPHSRGEFMAVRRREFLHTNGFNENLPCQEDNDFVLRVSKLGRFVFISDLTVYETMRRIRKTGFLKVLKIWVIDYIFLILFKRTVSKTWEPVR